jgi:hypothetical protein
MASAYSDFTVDLKERRVTHKSGAAAEFYEYPAEEDWLKSLPHSYNDYLYPGPSWEFLRLAKEAALAAGMKHCKP